MNFGDKFKRSTNFTAAESDLLISLVKKYKSVVECMKTDSVNTKMKKDAWSKIENEFNSQCIDNPRSSLNLKNKYENIKRLVKKQYANEKAYYRGTGGGPSKSFSNINPTIVSTIGDMLQNKMTGEPSEYDSDKPNNVCQAGPNDTEKDDNVEIIMEDAGENVITVDFFDVFSDTGIEKKTVDESSEKLHLSDYEPCATTSKRDWIHYTPADLKSRSTLTSNSKSTDDHVSKKQKTYQDKITRWASARASLSDQQQSAFIEQHKLKMDLMRERHTIEMKMMNEKHQMEVENLKLQNEILQIQKKKLLQ